MGLGQPAVPGPAQATPPDGLRMRALNPSPPSVFDGELGGLLPLPRGYVQSMRLRTAAWRSDKPSAHGITVVNAHRQAASAGCPRAGKR
jgi:hypothetical protein